MRLLQWQARQSQPGEQSLMNAWFGSRTGEGRAGCAVGEKKRVCSVQTRLNSVLLVPVIKDKADKVGILDNYRSIA